MDSGKMFSRYIGIDYSGASTTTDRKPAALAVCCAVGNDEPRPVDTCAKVPSAKNWTRMELANWLVKRLKEPEPTLVGIDHGFSFPIDYFKRYFGQYELPEGQWDRFLEDFQRHWPTDKKDKTVARILHAQEVLERTGATDCLRLGNRRWLRLTDRIAGASSSVFDFRDKPNNVAHSTHAGLPWLLWMRQKLKDENYPFHFWPFDGWVITEPKSVVVEVYPALWNWRFDVVYPNKGGHKHDAYSIARWMSETDRSGMLRLYFKLLLTLEQRKMAETEGWIFGVLGSGRPCPR